MSLFRKALLGPLFIGVLLFGSCQSESPKAPPSAPAQPQEQEAIPAPKDPAVAEPTIESQVPNPNFELNSWMALVDTAFPADPKFEKLTDLVIDELPKKFIMALNRDGLEQVQRYQSFWLLTYANKKKAKHAFDELLALAETLTQKRGSMSESREGFNKFYNTVYKGGALYLLKDNRIVHRGLNCSDTFEEYENQETALLTTLYGTAQPDTGSYFRYCCSCPPGQNITIK